MKLTIKVLVWVLTIFTISGCTSVIESKPYKTYRVGSMVNATVGMSFLEAQTGTKSKVKRWVGLMASPNGWKVEDVYSDDFIKKELVYSGKSGSTIEIGYREYRGGYAAPAFYQSVKYDLNESNIINFQNFGFQVTSANNTSINLLILHD